MDKGAQEELPLREKNRLSAKEFIKMKRKQLKQEQTHVDIFAQLKEHIQKRNAAEFGKALSSQSPELMLNFLFSQNEVKNTPLTTILGEHREEGLEMLAAVNKWAAKNKPFLVSSFKKEGASDIKMTDWRNRFYQLNKAIVQRVDSHVEKKEDITPLVKKLAMSEGLFVRMADYYLDMDLIIMVNNSLKINCNSLKEFYLPWLTQEEVEKVYKQLSVEVKAYCSLLQGNVVWKVENGQHNFGYALENPTDENLQLLKLKELDYNCWHHLATMGEKLFFSFIEDAKAKLGLDIKSVDLILQLLQEPTTAGETPIDIALRSWSYQGIKQLFKKAQDIEQIMASSNTLHKIMDNFRLKQEQKEELMEEVLRGDMSTQGFVKVLPKFIKHTFKNPGVNKVIHLNTSQFTFNICFDKNELKNKLNPCGMYPLLTYLRRYKHQASLKTLQLLFLDSLIKKDVKKKYLLLLRTEANNDRVEVAKDSQGLATLRFLRDIHQPLWKEMTKLPHGQVLQYLLSKVHVNCCELFHDVSEGKWLMTKGYHFIRYYIQNNPSLALDPINRSIVEGLTSVKESERKYQNYDLYDELIRSLADLEEFHTSQDYVCSMLRDHLVKHAKTYTSERLLLKRSDKKNINQLGENRWLLKFLARPLLEQRPQKSFLTIEEIIGILGQQNMKKQTSDIDEDEKSQDEQKPQQVVRVFLQDKKIMTDLLIAAGLKEKPEKEQQFKSEGPIYYSRGNLSWYYHMKVQNQTDTHDLFFDYLQATMPVQMDNWNFRNKFKQGFFSLSTLENHLVRKMKRLLSMGLDPCFLLSCRPLRYQIQEPIWEKIINRMVRERCSFMTAVITQADAKFSDFEQLFQACKDMDNQLFHQNLMKHVFREKENPLKYPDVKELTNIEFIIDYMNHLELPDEIFTQKLTQVTMRNVDIFLSELGRLGYQMKLDPSKKMLFVKSISLKQKEMVTYIDKWIPFLIEEAQKRVKQQVVMEDIINKVGDCISKEYPKAKEALLRHVPFEKIYKDYRLAEHKIPLLSNKGQQMVKMMELENSQYGYNVWEMFDHKVLSKLQWQDLEPLLNCTLKHFSQQQNKYQECEPHNKDKNEQDLLNRKAHITSILRKVDEVHRVQAVVRAKRLKSTVGAYNNEELRPLLASITNASMMTANLLLIDLQRSQKYQDEYYFFFKEGQNRPKRYSNITFFAACSDDTFAAYIQNLKTYWKDSTSIQRHLKVVVNDLITNSKWQRLEKITKIAQIQYEQQLLPILMQALASDLDIKTKIQQPAILNIIDNLYERYLGEQSGWNESLFINTCKVSIPTAFKWMPPKQLDDITFNDIFNIDKRAIAPYMQKAAPKMNWLDKDEQNGYYYLHRYNQCYLQAGEDQCLRICYVYPEEPFSSLIERLDNLPANSLHHLIDPLEDVIVRGILTSYHIQSMEPFVKHLANTKELVKGKILENKTMFKFINSVTHKARNNINKKGRCVSLEGRHPLLIKEFISQGFLSPEDEADRYSCFLRMVDRGDLQLLDLFLRQNSVDMRKGFLDGVATHFGYTFWSHLLDIQRDDFVISVIKRYSLLDKYSPEQYSQGLLQNICTYKRNQLLSFFIDHFTAKTGKKVEFAAETGQNKYQITEGGTFFMPTDVARQNNFYQCYFLILESHNQCNRFNLSGRFISKVDSEAWNYLPEFKRRVEIHNELIENIREAEALQFRMDVITTSVFDLNPTQNKEGKLENPNGYVKSLCGFISQITNGKVEFGEGVFQQICLLVAAKEETKIPESELHKAHPAQMALYEKLRNLIKQSNDTPIPLEEVFRWAPSFKPHLLTYNPDVFFKNPAYVNDLKGQNGQRQIDYSSYMKGVTTNVLEMEKKAPEALRTFIQECFFASTVPLGTTKASMNLTRDAFVLLVLDVALHDRDWDNCQVYKEMVRHLGWNDELPERVLYDFACLLNKRDKDFAFDMMAWQKITEQLSEIGKILEERRGISLGSHKMTEQQQANMVEIYGNILKRNEELSETLTLTGVMEALVVMIQHQTKHLEERSSTLFLELSVILNTVLLEIELRQFLEQIKSVEGGRNLTGYQIALTPNASEKIELREEDQLYVEMGYDVKLVEEPKKKKGPQYPKVFELQKFFSILWLQTQFLRSKVQPQLYLIKLKKDPSLAILNSFCASDDRQPFFKNMLFEVDLETLNSHLGKEVFELLYEYAPLKTDGGVGKIIAAIDRLEERLMGTRSIKLYNPSDIYGPINFNADTASNQSIADCLSFYELLQLPKKLPVKIGMGRGETDGQANQRILTHIHRYIDYYLRSSRQDLPQDVEIENQIVVDIVPSKDGEGLRASVDWSRWGAWNVAQLFCLILNYCGELAQKMQKVLDVRVSYLSLLRYYEEYLKIGCQRNMKATLDELLYSAPISGLIESILMMISEDVRNIMQIVKGIIVRFQINEKPEKPLKNNLIINEWLSARGVNYQVKDQLLSVDIYLHMQKGLNKEGEVADQVHHLVERKQFLDSVFTSVQFLTDYFLVRNDLNSQCVKLSTSLSRSLNSTINLTINYQNLYKWVEKMRDEEVSIKQIEISLTRLKQYLVGSMDKVVNTYISSNQVANQQQILLINKCEAINRDLGLDVISHSNKLRFNTGDTQPQSGLSEVEGLMQDIGANQEVKSAFLIQIYKSYYTTLVREGMTFVVGYKSSKKKAEVVTIKKAENINDINIVELEFIMLVSKHIPSNDELNSNKIIRIFATDSIRSLYKLNERITRHFMELPSESDERKMAHFAPAIPSDLTIMFHLADEQPDKDTPERKIFGLQVGKEAKLKLKPNLDPLPSPTNLLKKSVEFKAAMRQLQQRFREFSSKDFGIEVQLPAELTEETANANLPHILRLVLSDMVQLLDKFEFEPMRNPSLDSKLSIERGFVVNKNGIVELRRIALFKYLSSLKVQMGERSRVEIEGDKLVVALATNKLEVLPSVNEYMYAVLEQLIGREKHSLPSEFNFDLNYSQFSNEKLFKILDILVSAELQIHEAKAAIETIERIYADKISTYKLQLVEDRRSEVICADNSLLLRFNTSSTEREFYGVEDIVRAYLKTKTECEEWHNNSFTHYNPTNRLITIESPPIHALKINYQTITEKWVSQEVNPTPGASNSIAFNIAQEPNPASQYFITDVKGNDIISNYFYAINQNSVKQRKEQVIKGKDKWLYLQSTNPINLNFSSLSISQRSPLQKDDPPKQHLLTHHGGVVKVLLASKNVYALTVNSPEAKVINISYGNNKNLLSQGVEACQLAVISDGEVDLNSTKFIEINMDNKKNPVMIKEKEEDSSKSEFKQTTEVASKDVFESKEADRANTENLIYVVNEECKKYLTRAGEPRTDFIQLCDSSGNPVNWKENIEVCLVHINKLAVIRPELIRRGQQLGLRWCPTIKGHYYLYINSVRINPSYEIGVCAGQADFKNSVVTAPKVTKICYCEESELMFELKDTYDNIYAQLEQEILGDSLLIELNASKFQNYLKVDKTKINKYGQKKVRFSFNASDAEKGEDVHIQVSLNFEPVCAFDLQIEGYSLQQRKKLLDKDINSNNKHYYKDITVVRNRFLEDLFTIAEKSLHVTLSVKFQGEPGIDAGGVKREFYDLVGREMSSERNPFFCLPDPSSQDYFLNPELLRNKKRLEYMELWGKYVSNSILNGYLIGINFSPVFVKLLYEHTVDYQDLFNILPPADAKRYQYLLTASAEEIEDLQLDFTVMVDRKKMITHQLKQGGAQIQVTKDNVQEYLTELSRVLLVDRYEQLITAFRKGFDSVLKLDVIRKWIRPTEFWCITAGNKEITPELIMDYTVFHGHNIEKISGWFRRYISEASRQQLLGFLKFSSGSSSMDFSMTSKVTVTFENAGDNPKKLPISHTCWKEIVVPKYKNYDIMKKLLYAAFVYCSEGFGFG